MAALGPVMLKQIIFTEPLWRQMCTVAEENLPEEACGLLSGIDQHVHEVIPILNILHSSVRYRMDPRQQLRVFQQIEENGLELIGIFHSHPTGPDHPSETDIAEAYYPESASVILYPDENKWAARAFLIDPPAVNEIPLIITTGI